MEEPIKLLRGVLVQAIADIDCGHSNSTEEDMEALIGTLKKYTHKDEYCTKYEACSKYLNGISRATFDNLVATGKLPRGEKRYAGDNTLFWKVTDLIEYNNRNKRS